MSAKPTGRGDTGNPPISIRLPPKLRLLLDALAAETGSGRSSLARELVEEGIKRRVVGILK